MISIKNKRIKYIFFPILLGFILLGIFIYIFFFAGNIKKNSFAYIPTNASYQQVLDSLKPKLIELESFKFMANIMDYPQLIKAGKYKLNKGESNYSLIKKLRNGSQFEQHVVIQNYSSMTIFAGKVSKYFEADSATFMKAIREYNLKNNISDLDELKAKIIPNTYNFYWNTQVNKIIDKLIKEHTKFWTIERKNKAKLLNLSPLEITTLASIVLRESSKEEEQAKIAGLYLNRLNKNMRLESDPTVIYAKQQSEGFNLIIRRVLNKDLQINSPYNTYKNLGLPPYPICIPSIHAIDAVLSPNKNNYLFMCAQPNFTQFHNFATTYAEHQLNAKKYTDWLNAEGILK